jgi:primosomal protein N' (replication factor Y)
MEIAVRKAVGCPPFGDIALVTFTGLEEARVLRGAVKFRDSLAACLKQADYTGEVCSILGPAPCPVMKINNNFRYRLTLRCHMTGKLRQLLAHLLRAFSQDRENRNLCAFIDVNGFE